MTDDLVGFTAEEYFKTMEKIRAMTPAQRQALQEEIQKDLPEGLFAVVESEGYLSITGSSVQP